MAEDRGKDKMKNQSCQTDQMGRTQDQDKGEENSFQGLDGSIIWIVAGG